ncbi:hypothetical protein MMC11_005490 [Xylographa trunciseda]|nr:hypothetical protein [Xylographa trunciseda]
MSKTFWNYRSTLKTRKKAYEKEIERRIKSGESAFRGHEKRYPEPLWSDFESASNDEDGFHDENDEDYDDETGSIADCFGRQEELEEDGSGSTDDDTGSDDDEDESREPTITIDGPEDLGNEAMAAQTLDEGPISERTRSRSNSPKPCSDSERSPSSPYQSGLSTLSPQRARATSARPNARHIVSSPVETRIPVRIKKPRRQSTLF